MKGEVVIIDDTVDHKEYSRGRDVSPHGNYWIYCHAHGRFEREAISKPITYSLENIKTIHKQWDLPFHHISYFPAVGLFRGSTESMTLEAGLFSGLHLLLRKMIKVMISKVIPM